MKGCEVWDRISVTPNREQPYIRSCIECELRAALEIRHGVTRKKLNILALDTIFDFITSDTRRVAMDVEHMDSVSKAWAACRI